MRIELPGGQWAELRDVDSLTGSDQDDYFDKYDELIASAPLPEPQPDPSNPAVMLPAERKLGNAGGRALRDHLLRVLITSWSFDAPLPYGPEARKQLPVRACNALYEAIGPMRDAIQGTEDDDGDAGPKPGAPSGTGGSSGSSADGTGSPLQGSPADPSGTP